jgi:hypothetical protein
LREIKKKNIGKGSKLGYTVSSLNIGLENSELKKKKI